MVGLYQLLDSINKAEDEIRHAIRITNRCTHGAKEAVHINPNMQSNIIRCSISADNTLTDALVYLASIEKQIASAWEEFRAKYPAIPAQYFVFDTNGDVHEASKEAYDKIPKPVDDYHVPSIDYGNYEDIPGTRISIESASNS